MRRVKIIYSIFLLIFCIGNVSFAKPDSKSKRKTTSGIYGYVYAYAQSAPGWEDTNPSSYWVPGCEVIVKRAGDKKIVARMRADQKANFTITLKPGKYLVTPGDHPYKDVDIHGPQETPVTVWKGYYTEVVATFQGNW